MPASVDILNPDRPKRIVIVASNLAVSEETGMPIGFWWAELAHPFLEFTQHGYEVDIASPDGGPLRADSWSDPRDESGYSAEDLISRGFVNSPTHMRLVEESNPLADVRIDNYDGLLLVGGQGPMYTFWNNERLHALVAGFYEAGKVTAVICHATCILLETRLSDGRLRARRLVRRPPRKLHRAASVQGRGDGLTGSDPVITTVTRRVRPGHEAAYEQFLEGIVSAARRFPGHRQPRPPLGQGDANRQS